MRKHTVIGERVLSAAPALREVAKLVRSTHERWDGSGYPDGLAAEDNPARSAHHPSLRPFHTHDGGRPYDSTMSTEEAVEELRRSAGTQLTPSW